jgi:hypothetical protein
MLIWARVAERCWPHLYVNIDNQIIQSVLRKGKGEVSPILWLDSNSTVFRATYREFDNQRCCRHRGCQLWCPGILAGGTQNRDFDCRDLLVNIDNHPGPYYEMREAKFPRLRGPIR